jgi:Cu/Ag efflux pump CusA
MIGGMISSTALTLLVIPAIYALWKERQLAHGFAATPEVLNPSPA